MPGFDENQPRDENGQWIAAGGGVKSAASDSGRFVTNETDAQKVMREFMDKLTEDEKQAVSFYTGSGYWDMNRALRMERDDLVNQFDHVIPYLDQFLQEAPKWHGESYRGLTFGSPDGYETFKNDLTDDNIIMDKAYGSTSILPEKVQTFTGEYSRYAIELRMKGKSGVFLGPLASYDTEKEVLFPRGTKFRVKSVKEEESDLPVQFATSMDAQGRMNNKRKKLIAELEEL